MAGAAFFDRSGNFAQTPKCAKSGTPSGNVKGMSSAKLSPPRPTTTVGTPSQTTLQPNAGRLRRNNVDLSIQVVGVSRLTMRRPEGAPQAEVSVRAGGIALRADVREDAAAIRVPADPRMVSRLANRYVNPALGQLTVTSEGSSVTFQFPSAASRVGTRTNSDGSVSFVMIDPATFNWRLLTRPTAGDDALVIRDVQREYVFSPAD